MNSFNACGCDATFTREQWLKRPLGFYFVTETSDGVPFVAEARDCVCGSTISAPVQSPCSPRLFDEAVARAAAGSDEDLANETIGILRGTERAMTGREARRLPYSLEVSP